MLFHRLGRHHRGHGDHHAVLGASHLGLGGSEVSGFNQTDTVGLWGGVFALRGGGGGGW